MGKKIVEKPDKGDDGSEANLEKNSTKSAVENKVKTEDSSDTILSSAFQEFMKTRLQYSKWVRKGTTAHRDVSRTPKNFLNFFFRRKN